MAKRKRNNGVPPPVTVELMWVKDDDGTILRWADITDYDACAKAPHEPRTYILRLSDNTVPRGKRLHNMANWAGWRKAVREIPVNEIREWTACSAEHVKRFSDEVIADWAKRHDISRLPGELRCMVEDAASLDLLASKEEVRHA